MGRTNAGTPMDADGWADVLVDIAKLQLDQAGGANDMNADSKGVTQEVTEYGFPLTINNLSEFTDNPAAIQQIRSNLQIPSGLPGLFNLGGIPIGGTVTTTTYASGSGTHTFKLGKLYAYFRLTGAGGQGGGSPAGGDVYGGGGGQGATVFGCIKIDGIRSCTYAVGAGGSGGTSSSAGGDGASSTIVVNGITITAYPGTGGQPGGTQGVSDLYGFAGAGGSAEFQIAEKHTQWGFAGAGGRPGRFDALRGQAGGDSPTNHGGGGSGGGTGNAGSSGNAGVLTFYEI
jgi:hypothetical protein